MGKLSDNEKNNAISNKKEELSINSLSKNWEPLFNQGRIDKN